MHGFNVSTATGLLSKAILVRNFFQKSQSPAKQGQHKVCELFAVPKKSAWKKSSCFIRAFASPSNRMKKKTISGNVSERIYALARVAAAKGQISLREWVGKAITEQLSNRRVR